MPRGMEAIYWKRMLICCLLCLIFLSTGCQSETNGSPSSNNANVSIFLSDVSTPEGELGAGDQERALDVELLVSADVVLEETMKVLAKDFQKKYPHVVVTFNFSPTATLLESLFKGGKVDLLFVGSYNHFLPLMEDGYLMEEWKVDFIGDEIVFLQLADRENAIESFGELNQGAITTIGLLAPEVDTSGTVVTNALSELGNPEDIPLTIYANTLAELESLLRSRTVDGIFLLRSNTDKMENVSINFILPDRFYNPIIYPGGISSRSNQVLISKLFLDFISSPRARNRFRSEGFILRDEKVIDEKVIDEKVIPESTEISSPSSQISESLEHTNPTE